MFCPECGNDVESTAKFCREADIFRAVIVPSVVMAALIGLLTLLQAYFRAVIVPSVVMAALIGLLTLLQAYWAPLQVMVPMPPVK